MDFVVNTNNLLTTINFLNNKENVDMNPIKCEPLRVWGNLSDDEVLILRYPFRYGCRKNPLSTSSTFLTYTFKI